MWVCKRCGAEVRQQIAEYNLLDKNKVPYKSASTNTFECLYCYSWGDEIEEIADWEEEE